MLVASDWTLIKNKPSTFTPTAHNHSATNITSGTLAIARGGTNISSLTGNGGKFLAVNSGGTAYELVNALSGGGSYNYNMTDINTGAGGGGGAYSVNYQTGVKIIELIWHNGGLGVEPSFIIAKPLIASWGMISTPGGLVEDGGTLFYIYDDYIKTWCTVIQHCWN